MFYILLTSLSLVLFPSITWAAECTIGYEPQAGVILVRAQDVQGMTLSEADKALAREKIDKFHSREQALRTEYRDQSAELTLMLAEEHPDRVKVDAVVAQLGNYISDLNDLRITYIFEMTDFLKAANARRIRTRPEHRDSRCDGAIMIPVMRQALTGKIEEIIGMSEDEAKYLKDFGRREAVFRSERELTQARLNHALRTVDVDRTAVRTLLDELLASIRRQAINRLDRYFYADQVLFSPERRNKLDAFYAKHTKQANPLKRVPR